MQRRLWMPLLLLVALAGCAVGLSEFRPYHAVGARQLTERTPIRLVVHCQQAAFEFDPEISQQELVNYVRAGVGEELREAGFQVVGDEDPGVPAAEVTIHQVDMGYELFFWWYGVGYSASELVATVQLRVAVLDPRTGRRYDRHFAGYQTTHARKFWVYFIPIPFSVAAAEKQLMLRVSQQVFSEVAQAVAGLFAPAQGG